VHGVEVPGGAVRTEVDTSVTDIRIACDPTDHGAECTLDAAPTNRFTGMGPVIDGSAFTLKR